MTTTETAPDVDRVDAGMPTVTAAYAGLLAAYDEVNQRANAADRERYKLRKLVDEVPVGAFGDWQKTLGEPTPVMDQAEVRRIFAELGRPVPMKAGNPPLKITFVGRVDG